jgi:protoporphyrin/coproporphyrin ferrochelatase
LNAHGPNLPVYGGNRHWHPMLPEVIQQMVDDGIRRALAFVTSAFGSYPGCRQYLEDIERARQEVGAESPQVEKLRLFYNHPGFVEPMAERVWEAMEAIQCTSHAPREGATFDDQPLPTDPHAEREEYVPRLVFTAHSIPSAVAATSPYEAQLREACELVVQRLRVGVDKSVGWDLVYQNRSGPPSQLWLGPDVRDHLRALAAGGEVRDVVIAPIGFLSEHVEIVYDLDIEVAALCEELGLNMVRSEVVGCHPRFVRMIRELVMERLHETAPRLALGTHGPWPDHCPEGCCKSG